MITVIGMDGSPLGPAAGAALASATLLVGARRHLAALPVLSTSHAAISGTDDKPSAATTSAPGITRVATAPAPPAAAGTERGAASRTVVLGELAPALDALAAHQGDAVVLASGDPGFFGIVRALRERGLPVTVLPAVSSVALAFARAGLPWDDAAVVSAHGRDLRPAINVCRAHPKVAVLTGPGAGPAEIGAALDGWDRRLVVCEHLGSPAERITECSPATAARQAWPDPNVVLVLAAPHPNSVIMGLLWQQQQKSHDHDDAAPHTRTADGARGADEVQGVGGPEWAWPRRAPWAASATQDASAGQHGSAAAAGWALGEDEFDSRDAVITKAEVRALALARLAPAPGTLVWDVGAGAGSVGVECARFGAAVIAVERDALRCDRIRANAARHGVDVRVVEGEAPQALHELPAPDAVFVGGGAPAALAIVTARRPARIVVALAALERAGPAQAALSEAGYLTGGALLSAARFAPLPGGVHRLAATNPVFIVWAARPGTIVQEKLP